VVPKSVFAKEKPVNTVNLRKVENARVVAAKAARATKRSPSAVAENKYIM